jgi:hypothetical protein
MRESRIISKRDLMILLNEIYLSRKKVFSVKYPFYDLTLFNIDSRSYEIRNIATEDGFMTARTKRIPESNFLERDLPRFTDLRDCLITSSYLPFKNFEPVKQRLLRLARTITSPGGRSKPLYLGLDTNLVYLKFFSRYFPLKGEEGERPVTAIDFRIALSDLVKEEIDAKIKHKYRGSNITKMKRTFGNAAMVDEFFNASARKTRMAKSAQNEIKLLFAELEAERAESDIQTDDKEERDRLIAKSYSAFERDRGGEVFLLTADEDMAYHAKNAGLLQETLLIPHNIPQKGYITPCQLSNLLYDITIVFGVIRLSGTGVTVFGEWKGKGFEDYTKEHLKIWIDHESRLFRDLDRDLRITKRMDELSRK